MYYFIPAWYPQSNWWDDPTSKWYRPQSVSFDDTLSQMKLFKKHRDALQVLVLNYYPTLRYFLHRYDVDEVPSWSAFDVIQDIKEPSVRVLSIDDLSWPEGTEFVHTPFVMVAFHANQKIATIEFGIEGQLLFVEQFEQGELVKRLTFDDRGFLSSITHYRHEQPHSRDYLNLDGKWQIRQDLVSGQITVNPACAHRFHKAFYERIEDLIAEVLIAYTKTAAFEMPDFILSAASPAHSSLLVTAFDKKDLIWSFFKKRFPMTDKEQILELLSGVKLALTDSISSQRQLSQLSQTNLQQVPLYDSRLSLGKSREMKNQEIYLYSDGLTLEQLTNTLALTFEMMAENDSLILKVISYKAALDEQAQMTDIITRLLEEAATPYLYLAAQETLAAENDVDDSQEQEKSRVQLHFLTTEIAILAQLETARLVVDLSDAPDNYTQVAAISAGIPQINTVETEYVTHQENGLIITSDEELLAGYHYYLDTLTNWNHSLIYSVKKISSFTSDELVNKIETGMRKGSHV
ncbi:accessory Sec system protein Asp1 [Streptococcus gallolyticus]|uniref:Accessory Sec system protein Asp1 n=1 Tax=Streptococcus gallolyticus TaxID=315405 RepID=A0A368UC55_9STRE|nr:accessory Sec system protein Asp1 [Streptococcus gallolyticus]RCW16501.1 accessory Sec system protein Asp1 [Streptococcus gallolyticus]